MRKGWLKIMSNNWWIYLIIIAGLIVVYLIIAFITSLFMKRAYKKAVIEYEKLHSYEKERFDFLLSVINEMKNDGRFLPKSLLETMQKEEDSFKQIPPDLASIKSQSDFMNMYLRKYLKEKRLLNQEKYLELDRKLESSLFLDPSDKTSPYYIYNKKASHYNAYLGMLFVNLFNFKKKNSSLPIL